MPTPKHNPIKVVSYFGYVHDADLEMIADLLTEKEGGRTSGTTAWNVKVHHRLTPDPDFDFSEVGTVLILWEGETDVTDEQLFEALKQYAKHPED